MIQLKHVRKQYGQCVALDQVSLDMEQGKVYGLWGRNGAGKTTLIRIILGVLRPDYGTIRVFGNDPKKDWSIRKGIGIVSDEDDYFPELTVEEFLWWIGKLRSVEERVYKEQIEIYTRAFYIEEHRNHLIGSLSYGTRQKVSVIGAFIGAPKWIIMDEPLNGLDIDSVEALCSLLREHREDGGAALIACHNAIFIKHVCTDIIEIDKGKIVRHGPAASLDIRFPAWTNEKPNND